MTPQEKKQLEQLGRWQLVAEMMMYPGWKVMSEYIASRIDALKGQLTDADSWDKARLLQGQIQALESLTAWANTCASTIQKHNMKE